MALNLKTNSWAFLSSLCLAIGMMSCGCSRPDNDFVEPPPPTVTTAKPVQQDMTLFYENNGETEATNSAEVRARVRGFIEELVFEPGQVVSEGDPLYRIEPEQYAAAKMQAEAQVESATASISAAKAAKEANAAEVERSENELRRFKKLLESNAGSQSEYDQALAARDAAVAQSRGSDAAIELSQAELSVAKAALAQADLDLNYTTVRAPISGRISRTLIDRGNLADNGSSLASIVDRERIYVYFTIDERTLLELMKQRPEDRRSGPVDWSKVPVYLQRDEADSQWRRGKLEYVDQTGINQQTGTLSLRAVFDNPNDDLLPGMFVTVRLPVNQVKDGVLVPQRAIMGSQQGQFLMVVGSDNRVEQRPVRLGQKLDGWVLVTDGLDKDEQFVVDGIQRARPGAAVDPKLTELSTDDSPILKAAIELKAGSESRPSDSKPESETAPDQSSGNGDAEKNNGGQADSPQEVESAS